MHDDHTNGLLDAVDALTEPLRTKVIQDGPVGSGLEGQKTVPVVLPSLLTQLDDSIRSSLGSGSAGGKLAFEGAILNTAALFTAMKISSQIRDWCVSLGVVPVKHSAKDLRAWYVARLTKPQDDDLEKAQILQLTSWAKQIRTLLDPPRERDLPDNCPICNSYSWWKDGSEFYRPLVIRYRATGADMIQQATALCRACDVVWGVRELAYELEQRLLRDWDEAIEMNTALLATP